MKHSIFPLKKHTKKIVSATVVVWLIFSGISLNSFFSENSKITVQAEGLSARRIRVQEEILVSARQCGIAASAQEATLESNLQCGKSGVKESLK